MAGHAWVLSGGQDAATNDVADDDFWTRRVDAIQTSDDVGLPIEAKIVLRCPKVGTAAQRSTWLDVARPIFRHWLDLLKVAAGMPCMPDDTPEFNDAFEQAVTTCAGEWTCFIPLRRNTSRIGFVLVAKKRDNLWLFAAREQDQFTLLMTPPLQRQADACTLRSDLQELMCYRSTWLSAHAEEVLQTVREDWHATARVLGTGPPESVDGFFADLAQRSVELQDLRAELERVTGIYEEAALSGRKGFRERGRLWGELTLTLKEQEDEKYLVVAAKAIEAAEVLWRDLLSMLNVASISAQATASANLTTTVNRLQKGGFVLAGPALAATIFGAGIRHLHPGVVVFVLILLASAGVPYLVIRHLEAQTR